MDPQVLVALQTEFAKPAPDLARIGSLLQSSMLQLASSGLLVSSPETLQPSQLAFVRDILEMGAYWSVHTRNGASFERYLRQLTPYIAAPSAYSSRTPVLLGLHLLNLLVTGRIPEYRVRLAALTRPGLPTLAPVEFVVRLERCLQEGLYHRLLEARDAVPAPEYVWLVDSLVETVQRELAAGIEKAFEVLEVRAAATILLFGPTDTDATLAFGASRGWTLDKGHFVFKNASAVPKDSETNALLTVPKVAIDRALSYANALEQIV